MPRNPKALRRGAAGGPAVLAAAGGPARLVPRRAADDVVDAEFEEVKDKDRKAS